MISNRLLTNGPMRVQPAQPASSTGSTHRTAQWLGPGRRAFRRDDRYRPERGDRYTDRRRDDYEHECNERRMEGYNRDRYERDYSRSRTGEGTTGVKGTGTSDTIKREDISVEKTVGRQPEITTKGQVRTPREQHRKTEKRRKPTG